MATREQLGQPLDTGLLTRLIQGVRYMISGGSKGLAWFGPGQPLQPVAQDESKGRRFDYPVNYNTRTRVRDSEVLSFWDLRGLARGDDLVSILIQRRIDQMRRLRWGVRMKDKNVVPDPVCEELEDLLKNPDDQMDWNAWLSMILSDNLICDAVCIEPLERLDGKGLAKLRIVDPSTIRLLLDGDGRTPQAPDPFAQQRLKGLPANDLTTADLIYVIENPRSDKIYGYSRVEQARMTINTSIRRRIQILEQFTAGNIPDAFIGTPENWTPQQIADFQIYWDALLEGNTAERKKAKFVPSNMKVQFSSDALNEATKLDEWLTRQLCACFGVSPQPYVSNMNRATAETAEEMAASEGLAPLQMFVADLINKRIILERYLRDDVEFYWQEDEIQDPLAQAQVAALWLDAGVITPSEAREKFLGFPPLTPEQKAELEANKQATQQAVGDLTKKPTNAVEQQDANEESGKSLQAAIRKSAKKKVPSLRH